MESLQRSARKNYVMHPLTIGNGLPFHMHVAGFLPVAEQTQPNQGMQATGVTLALHSRA
jgi:hypothetical protein